MKRSIPAVMLCCLLLAACNSSNDSSEGSPLATGGLNPPTAIASDLLAPPTGNQLPADLLPPS